MKLTTLIARTEKEYDYSDPHESKAMLIAALRTLENIERWLSEGATIKATKPESFSFEIKDDGVTAGMTVTGAKAGTVIPLENVIGMARRCKARI